MRNGGSDDECMGAMSSKSIRMIPLLIPYDKGFIAKEKDLKTIFTILLIIMIFTGISIIVLTIYKSFQQKQKRLDLLRCREYNSKLMKSQN